MKLNESNGTEKKEKTAPKKKNFFQFQKSEQDKKSLKKKIAAIAAVVLVAFSAGALAFTGTDNTKEELSYSEFLQKVEAGKIDKVEIDSDNKKILAYPYEEGHTFDYKNQKRATPEIITELQPNEIFVFGSNLKGLHGGGASYIAYRKFGAVMGQGVGLQGQSYAIPTMQGGVEKIRPYVEEFIQFAKENQNLTFLVTRIGCGIAGFTDMEIAPLFENAHNVENIVLPPNW